MNMTPHINLTEADVQTLPLAQLRERWASVWGREPHARLSRAMLEKSLRYKIREMEGRGLTTEQQDRLALLVRQYKRNPKGFARDMEALKPGTRLVRNWNGKRHSVLVKATGFGYEGRTYSSLSQIATDITGTRWNGRAFFGLRGGSS